MLILINTCLENRIILAVKKNNKILLQESRVIKQAEKIKTNIYNFFNKYKIKLQDIEGIIVCKGPGRFTSLRAGVSAANALAYALDVPIVGIKINDFESLEKAFYIFPKLIKKVKKRNLVFPFYDKKPNINIKI